MTSRDYIRSAADPDLMRQAGVALRDHAATLAHNVDANRTEPPHFERMATNNALPRRHTRAFREFLAGEGQAFLERIDAWLSAHARAGLEQDLSRPTRDQPIRTGVGVYLIQDDEDKTREQGEPGHARHET